MYYEHVFGDLRPFAQCHASTLVRCVDGRLLVAWFGGTREGHRDSAIWSAIRSARPLGREPHRSAADAGPGAGWSQSKRIAKVAEEAHWNPVLFAPGGDEVALHFKVGATIRDWTTWASRSPDGGVSWQRAQPLVPGDRGGRGAVKNKPIRLSSGDWLAGASIESWRRWECFVDRSSDGFEGWQASPRIALDRRRLKGKGTIQPALWQSGPEHVHALLRSTEGVLYRSDSSDAGRTWCLARPTSIPNNNSGIDIVRMEGGRLALACNPVEGNWADRTPLSILFSDDNGETWPSRLDVETGPGEFSYPALIEDGQGLVLSFTWNRRRIAVVWITADEIPAR
jgi:predicted neuraminidase